MPSRLDWSVMTSENSATDCLHFSAKAASPYSSISGFELRPSMRSTFTSTQRPWQSKPFW